MESLSPEQVSFFRREGYLIVENVLGTEGLARADAAVREIVEEQRALGDAPTKLEWEPELVGGERIARRIYHPVDTHPAFEAAALSDEVLDRVESVFGPDLQFHHSKLNIKPAKVGSVVEWHQDFAYFPHTNTDLLACLIYLDDANEENGCLQVMPRQHEGRAIGHTVNGGFAGKITEPEWNAGMPEPVKCEGPAGTMIMMHCMTPHSSLPNRSGRPRRTLIMEFRAADAYPVYVGNQTQDIAAYQRQVRGKRAPEARFTLTAFPVPHFPAGAYTSLYDLQSRYRGD